MMRPLGLILTLLLAVPPFGGAAADVIFLTNGQQVEGELLPLNNGKVRIRLSTGSLTLPADRVAEVQPAHTPQEIVQRQLEALAPDDAEGVLELARWAAAEGAHTLERQLLREALERSPDHSEARRALGYYRQGEEWVTEEEYRIARGEVHFRGEWMSAATRDDLLKAEAEARTAHQQSQREAATQRRLQPRPENPSPREEGRSAGWDSPFGTSYAYVTTGYRYGHGYGYARPLAPFRIGQIQLAYPGHGIYLRPFGHHHSLRHRYTLAHPSRGIHRIGIGVIGSHR